MRFEWKDAGSLQIQVCDRYNIGTIQSRSCRVLKMVYSTSNPQHSFNILLVDDNEANVLITTAILKNGGFHIDECSNGIEAVEAAKRKKYDFVFMDCVMPLMDGFEAARWIRNHAESLNRDTPIVALTSNLDQFGKTRCIENGMTDCMSKPARAEELHAKLEKWMKQDDVANDFVLDSGLPVFDETFINSIFGDDTDGINELIQEFRTVLEVSYTELCNALNDSSDIEELRKLAHCMKGSARTIGAERLGSVMTRVEDACVAGDELLATSYEDVIHREYDLLTKRLQVR